MKQRWTTAAATAGLLCGLASAGRAQVLPPTAQPGVQALATAVGASRASLRGQEVRMTVGNKAVTLRHRPDPPWFVVTIAPPDAELGKRIEQALPGAFARNPWEAPTQPQSDRPLLAQLPDARMVSQRHALTVAVAALLVLFAGVVALLRRD